MIALQLYVEGQQVEMFDDETVTLSQSIQDVKAIDKIFTEFTQTFSVPASKVNNKIFKHFYNSDIVNNLDNPNVNSFDGRKKIDAELYLNYKPFKKGKIKLEGSTLKLNKPHTYRLTFFGNTVNLKDLLGDTKLSSLSFLANFNFKEEFIVDKTLLNFQLVGYIRLLFPNSKIIHCQRERKANCLSIYKNLFEADGPWCYNRKEINDYYNLYLDLMNFWDKKFPGEIYNIKYEDLILNPDTEIKKLIDTLKIGWDSNCLKFYENKNAIKTLSVNQARNKIYSSSMNLHEKYKPFLKEF